MGKTRSLIGRYTRRSLQRRVPSFSIKRKLTQSPFKSPLKSPYKSPLYKHHPSPAPKKTRTSMTTSARSLFRQQSNAENDRDSDSSSDDFNLLSSSTISVDEEVDLLYNIDSPVKSNSPVKSDSPVKSNSPVKIDSPVKSDTTDSTSTMIKLVPAVMKSLSEQDGLDIEMTKFFEMVAQGKFPLNNIAFLLWIEVVKWFGCSTTTRMRYSMQTKLFWKLGWRLFGARFVHFMGGFKSHSSLVMHESEKGSYSPTSAEINFAVPDLSVLRDFDPYEHRGAQRPRIYNDVISVLSEGLQNKSACITFDGKKIKQGLTEDSGDVDLLNHEKGLSLQQRKDELERDRLEVENAIFDVGNNTVTNKGELLKVLENSLKKISVKMTELSTVKERKNTAERS